MSAAARNQRVARLMDELFAEAGRGRPQLSPQVALDLQTIFGTTVRGFREIVLVITLARMINPTFKASTNFYESNPRSLFEGPIRDALYDRKIPHGKSGPLNVAKATEGINAQWAARKRPRPAAERVVALVNHIESTSPQELRAFAIVLHGMFLDEAQRVEGIGVDVEPNADVQFLFGLCERLILDAPDGGNTLQRIAGLLLKSYHEALQTGIEVAGAEDRASVTTTTSKKIGDLAEQLLDGTVVLPYEVTTKPFNEARVNEAYQSVRDFDARTGSNTPEVIVVCGRGQEHPDASQARPAYGYLGVLIYEDLAFHFVEVFGWIHAQLLRMPVDARLAFYEALAAYIADPNTSERVKRVWQTLHEAR